MILTSICLRWACNFYFRQSRIESGLNKGVDPPLQISHQRTQEMLSKFLGFPEWAGVLARCVGQTSFGTESGDRTGSKRYGQASSTAVMVMVWKMRTEEG